MKAGMLLLGLVFFLDSVASQVPIVLDPPAGNYSTDLTVKASVSPEFSLEYRFQSETETPFLPWEDLTLSALPGEERIYRMVLRARNNQSEVYQLLFTYKINKKLSGPLVLETSELPGKDYPRPVVFSPQNAARYDHRPWLIILDSYGQKLQYSVKASGMELAGGPYTGPVELPGGDNITLEVKEESGRVSGVIYHATPQSLPDFLPKPGFYRKELKLDSPPGEWSLSLNRSSYRVWNQPLSFLPQADIRSTLLVQAKSQGRTYEWPYVLEGRRVSPPAAALIPSLPPVLEIITPSDGITYLDTEKGSPIILGRTLPVEAYQESFQLFTQFPDGEKSPPLRMDSSQWTPFLSPPLSRTRSYGLEFEIPKGLQVVYELSEDTKNLQVPHLSSPRLELGGLFPAVPRGYLYQTNIQARYVDAWGHLGPPGSVQKIIVNRRVLPEPKIVSSGKGFRMEGTGHLFYRLTSGDVPPSDLGDLKLYKEAVLFPTTGSPGWETWWITALARDDQGNESLVVREKIEVDNRPSGIYGFRNLSGKVSLREPEVLLIPETAQVSGEIYYTLTTDSTEPGDPKTTGSLYTGPLPIKASEGEELTVRSLWNMKVGDQWHHDTPIPLEFTLDRKPPLPPKVSLASGRYELRSDRLVMKAEAADIQERVYYSLKKNSPSDPSGAGEQKPWKDVLTLEAAEGKETVYHLIIWSMDPAGNVTELPPHVIVLNAGEIPPPRLVNHQPQPTEEFTVEFTPEEGTLRYELTQGEQSPAVPSINSPVFPGKLKLRAEGDAVTVYQLRAVAQSASGRLGSPSSLFKFVLLPAARDPKVPPVPPRLPPPQIRGLPTGGLSSQDLKLTVENPDRYRFSLGSGETLAMMVTPLSSVFPEELVVRIPDGQKETFRLLLQERTTEQVFEYVFTLDKDPPSPPIPVVRESGKDLHLSFITEEPVTLRGVFTKVNFPHSQNNITGEWNAPVSIPLEDHSWGEFSWDVTASDAAGNISSPSRKTILWERQTVFLNSAALSEGDGTPERPFRSLPEALKMVKDSQVKRIVMAEGTYSLSSLVLLKDVILSGGHRKDSWRPEPGAETVLQLDSGAGLQVQGFSFLENLTLKQDQGLTPLLKVTDGQITWKNIQVKTKAEGESVSLVTSRGRAENLSIVHEGENSTVLLSLDHSDMEMPGLNLAQQGSRSVMGIRMMDSFLVSYGLRVKFQDNRNAFGVDLTGSTLEMQEADFTITGIRDSLVLGMLNSSLWTDQTSQKTLEGQSFVTALFCKDSQVRWQNGQLTLTSHNRKNIGLEFRGTNRADFQRERWTSSGGTILSGLKPSQWIWKNMETWGWD